MRFMRSSIHELKGFRDKKDTLVQLGGTWFCMKAVPIFSRTSVIAMRPASAARNCGKLPRMTLVTLLYFSHSCANTVLRHCNFSVGYLPITKSRSNFAGTSFSIPSAASFMTSSAVLPLPPPERGWMLSSVSIMLRATPWLVVISAFSCSPYKSGLICSNVLSMCSM